MDAVQFAQAVIRRLDQLTEAKTVAVVAGRIPNYEEYKSETSYLRAIQDVKKLIKDAAADFDEKDE